MKKVEGKRHIGIDIIGDMPWGTHFCQFYASQKDLLDILVPYFIKGLENNEFCMWITSEPLNVEEARKAIAKAYPAFEKCVKSGQIEILSYDEWYLRDEMFKADDVLNGWVKKLEDAQAKGFEGLRLTGNTFWLEEKHWKAFTDYEEKVNNVLGRYNMLALCTYSLDKCGANEIIDVVANHEFAIIKRHGKWTLIENREHKNTCIALRSSEERFRSVLDNARDIIYRFNLQTQKFEYISPSVEAIMGYSAESLIAMDLKELYVLINSDFFEELKNAQAQAEKNGTAEVEFQLRTKSGEFHWMLNRFSLIKDENDLPLYRDGSIRDINDQKKAERQLRESQEKLELTLSSNNVGIWEWNCEKDEVLWDERIFEMHMVKQDSSVKKLADFEELLNEEDIPHVRKAIKRALEDNVAYNTIYRLKNSDSVYINSKAHVYKDDKGKAYKMLGVCIDISEFKKSSERVLLNMNEELMRSNRELQNFAYIASHDLKEPLRMVSSFTQLLSQRYKNQLDAEAQEYIQFAVDGAKRMYDLLNGLLAFSDVHTKGKGAKMVNMEEILKLTLSNLSVLIAEKNAKITWDSLPVVFADESQMLQLLQNLVGNGIKFSTGDPWVHVSSYQENDHFVFSVKDNGIGIEPQYHTKVFQIFQRLHVKEKYGGGTGIGLAICKRIVERQKGKIWIDSTCGEGSTFFFSIPKTEQIPRSAEVVTNYFSKEN